jgi:hypothetical protein
MAMALLAGLLALLALALRDYGVGLPEFPSPTARTGPALPPPSAGQFERLLPSKLGAALRQDPEFVGPFYTVHFQPPTPKPPTTRKVNMTYLGLLESAEGLRSAFLHVDKATQIVQLGDLVVADLAVAAMDLRSLTLTNSASETNLLQFKVSKAVEVPIR